MGQTEEGKPQGLMVVVKWIQKIDEAILAILNRKSERKILQPLMSFLSHPPHWRELALIILLAVLLFGSAQARWRTGYLLLTVVLSDQTCNLLKALVKRVRPDGLRNINGSFWRRLGYYSFPSSHAANTFAAAYLFSQWWPTLTVPAYLAAALISFSRIYRNNHYPSDVLAGGLIGLGYACLVLKYIL